MSSKSDIWGLIHRIRDIQAEEKDADYFDTDWSTTLADLAVLLADAVEGTIGPDPRAEERAERDRQIAETERMVWASQRNPRYRHLR